MVIVRSLCMRMRTAKRFNPMKNQSLVERRCQKRLQEICSCFVPRTNQIQSNIYSCLCFRIQCRRHREIRLRIGRTEQRCSADRQPSLLTNCLSQDSQQISTMILTKIQRTRRIRDIHLSAMLIVLNVVYLIFNLPFNIHQTFAGILYRNQPDKCVMGFTQLLVDVIQQTYFSTNFFLYVLTNRRFREEFYNTMMRLCTRRREYLLRKSLREKRTESLSFNPSTGMIGNFNGDYQENPKNRTSIISDIELNELTISQRRTTLVLDENRQMITELVMSDENRS